MRAQWRHRGHGWNGLAVAFAIMVSLTGMAKMAGVGQAAQPETGEGTTLVRIVHGVADGGPLDIYVDGSLALIGIVLGETSGGLDLAAGEHELAVVPTGAQLDAALAAGAIDLQSDTQVYVALLGTTDATSVGLFRIDSRPVDAGQARFRVISGIPDADAVVPFFFGGEALSEPLGFGDASEYASLDAGTYDLDFLDGVTGASLLALPGTEFPEGTTTDIILIGQVADGSVTALVELVPLEVSRPIGRVAQIVAGTCEEPGEPLADLGLVQPGQGEAVGVPETTSVAQGFGLAAIPFATLISAPHLVVIAEDQGAGGELVACGEIGGRLTDTGALVIALRPPESRRTEGVAVLAPGLENPESTGVSIFLAVSGRAAVVGTPASG